MRSIETPSSRKCLESYVYINQCGQLKLNLIQRSTTLIYISTKWCAPCREMNPIVESLEDEFSDHLKIINIDLDNNNFIKEMYKISTIPLFVLYRNDKEIWRKNGIIAFSDVADKL